MQATEQPTPNPVASNTEFLWALLKALLALTFSAAVLLPAFLTLHTHSADTGAQAKTIPGNKLAVIMGTARPSINGLKLNKLAKAGEDNRAILSTKISFKAEDYPFVDYKITNRHPGTTVYLIWRTADNPEKIHNTMLYWNGDKTTTINMAKFEQWQGNITELGLDIYEDLRDRPMIIQQLTLQPFSNTTLMAATWSEWITYRGWTQRSAHHLRGAQRNTSLSPTLAVASWAGLALLLLMVSNIRAAPHNTTPRIIAYIAAGIIPWIALDMLWQSELNTQLNETKTLFAGKNQHEKHLAERDGSLYAYAKHLKDSVLPEPGAKILLLHDSEHRTYRRLKAQYYLLPHNVFNYDRVPRKGAVQTADYILALGKINGLTFSLESHTLNWKNPEGSNDAVKVTLIDSQPLGKLYKIWGHPE